MLQIVLIGLGAGAAAALLSASIASGSVIAILLFYLAPLPILIAALGWSHWAGLIAALSAAAGLAAILGLFSFVAFLIGVGIPAWWLGYLALLARPVGNGAAVGLEWYPVGRLVFWVALIGFLIVAIAVPNFGTEQDAFQAALRNQFERALRAQPPDRVPRAPTPVDFDRIIGFLVVVIPPLAAVVFTLVNTVNLWLAGRVVALSGRLKRPWPDLSTLALPPIASILLAAGIAGSFLPGLLGVIGVVLTVGMLTAFALHALAVVHSITRGVSGRPFLLGGLYLAIMLAWPILILIALVGLFDTFLDIRGFVARRRGPPAPRT